MAREAIDREGAQRRTRARALLGGACAAMVACLAVCVSQWVPGLARPVAAAPEGVEVLGPPWFQECLAYHHAFETEPAQPDVNPAGLALVERGGLAVIPDGFIGHALHVQDWRAPFTLKGPALSPHRPRTLSFWWALPHDLAIDGAYTLFYLRGRGFVAAFCRGKGEWCALQRPAGVFQVYDFPGIQNVNGIYDFDLLAHLDLRARVWHHTAVVFRRAATAQMYTDGQLVFEVTLSGRTFSEEDRLHQIEFGGPLFLDEVALLDRAVDGDHIADYVRGMARLREYAGPASNRP